ncbi:MAG: tyrosine recombinase XerC, partial [Gemmataceae bacterium]
MGLFKKSFTKAIPDKAEISSKNGVQIARWRDRHGKLKTARVTTGKTGQQRLLMETAEWYGRYRDEHGVLIERSTECRDKQAAEQILQRWIREVERVKAGVLTSAEKETRKHQASSFPDHVTAYIDHLRASDTSKSHQENTRRYLQRLARECDIDFLADLRATDIERWLSQREKEGMSARSRNAHRNALVAFVNWCFTHGRLATNPFVKLPKADEKSDPRRRRRAMSEDELVRLLQMARERPLAEAMTVRRGRQKGQRIAQVRPEVQSQLRKLGHERELIYKTLVLTGLRKNELKSLRVCQLNLDTEQPFVELYAADEKNREGCYIPLRADLVLEIKNWLQDKLKELQDRAKALGRPVPDKLPPDTPLFQVPNGLHRILDRDLKAAGIAKRDDRGRTLDVHALRTTFGTLLSKAGVSPRTAQAAMRHSDIKLTMGVYTDPRLLDVAGAVAALPSLSPPKSVPVTPLKASSTEAPKTPG